jgi:hypothetical protein
MRRFPGQLAWARDAWRTRTTPCLIGATSPFRGLPVHRMIQPNDKPVGRRIGWTRTALPSRNHIIDANRGQNTCRQPPSCSGKCGSGNRSPDDRWPGDRRGGTGPGRACSFGTSSCSADIDHHSRTGPAAAALAPAPAAAAPTAAANMPSGNLPSGSTTTGASGFNSGGSSEALGGHTPYVGYVRPRQSGRGHDDGDKWVQPWRQPGPRRQPCWSLISTERAEAPRHTAVWCFRGNQLCTQSPRARRRSQGHGKSVAAQHANGRPVSGLSHRGNPAGNTSGMASVRTQAPLSDTEPSAAYVLPAGLAPGPALPPGFIPVTPVDVPPAGLPPVPALPPELNPETPPTEPAAGTVPAGMLFDAEGAAAGAGAGAGVDVVGAAAGGGVDVVGAGGGGGSAGAGAAGASAAAAIAMAATARDAPPADAMVVLRMISTRFLLLL